MVDRIPQSDPGAEAPGWDRLARFFAGESGPVEAAEIERWLAADPARTKLFADLDRALDPALVSPPADVDVEASLLRIRARLDIPGVRSMEPAGSVRRRLARRRPPPVWRDLAIRAAAVIAAIGGPYLIYTLATTGPDPTSVAGVESTLVVTTRTAELDSLFLADGTRVLLGPGSTLAIHRDYGVAARELTLDGEAMFDVVHDDSRPFRVWAGDGVVQDLGTAFSVRTAPGGETRVVVTEGSVRLRHEADSDQAGVILYQGDRGSLDPTGIPVVERGVATEEDTSWTRGVLSFREATVTEIDAELQRWYGLRFSVSGADFAQRRLTASFDGETAAQVAEVIALAFGGRAEVRGDTIVIHPTGLP